MEWVTVDDETAPRLAQARPDPELLQSYYGQLREAVGNPAGMDFLLRDCTNVCSWFRARGLSVDEHELFGELLTHAF